MMTSSSIFFWQLAFPNAIYLVDAIQRGETLIKACKPALESNYITKVIHDCKRDSEIAYSLIEEQEGHARSPDAYISFVDLLLFTIYWIVSLWSSRIYMSHIDMYDCDTILFSAAYIWSDLQYQDIKGWISGKFTLSSLQIYAINYFLFLNI
ncbi:hypothetical protein UlMin_036503 [Ulmus minor]